MALTSTKSYSGTVEAASHKSLNFEREFAEQIDGNKRWQEPTGGWICRATYDVAGEDVAVEKTVTAAQVASLTLAQIVAAADALLRAKLGV